MTDTTASATPSSAEQAARRGRAQKNRALLIMVAAGVVTMLAWTQNWVSLDVNLPSGGQRTLEVDGAIAAPALTAFSLSLFALVAALAIAGRGFRIILGALAIILGACIGFETALVFANPVAAAAGAITEATGIAGANSVADVASNVSVEFWPMLAFLGAALAVFAGVIVLVTAARWPGSSKKYRVSPGVTAVNADAMPDAIDSWDGLSRGEDPTAPRS